MKQLSCDLGVIYFNIGIHRASSFLVILITDLS